MTVSPEGRRSDVERALTALLAFLGDRDVCESVFHPADESTLVGILPTTWDELLSRRWLHVVSQDVPLYRLSGAGWIAALRVTGRFQDESLKRQAITFLRAAKAWCDRAGRSDDQIVCVHDFESDGLSSAFVTNAVDGNLLDEMHPGRGYRLRWQRDPCDSTAPFFIIPRSFQLPPL